MEERERVREAFIKADENKDNQIQRKEFTTLLRSLNPDGWSDKKLDKLFKIIDQDGSGSVDIDEFLDWVFPETKSKDKKGGKPSKGLARKGSKGELKGLARKGSKGELAPAADDKGLSATIKGNLEVMSSSSSSSSSSDGESPREAAVKEKKAAKAKKKMRKAMKENKEDKPLYSIQQIFELLNEDGGGLDLQTVVERFEEAVEDGLGGRLSRLTGDDWVDAYWTKMSGKSREEVNLEGIKDVSLYAPEEISPLEVAHLTKLIKDKKDATFEDAIAKIDETKVSRVAAGEEPKWDITQAGLEADVNIGFGQFDRLCEFLTVSMILEEQQILCQLAWVEVGKFDLTFRMGRLIMERVFLQTGKDPLRNKIESNDFMRMCHVFKLVDNQEKKGIAHAKTSLFFNKTLANLPQLLTERDQKKSRKGKPAKGKKAKEKEHKAHKAIKGRVHLSVLFEELWKIWPDKKEMRSPLLLVLDLLHKYEIGDLNQK